MPEDDIPPSWMWPFVEAVNEWFDDLKAKRKQEAKDASDDREQVDLVQNEDPRIKRLKGR